jgi:hypothetical protein
MKEEGEALLGGFVEHRRRKRRRKRRRRRRRRRRKSGTKVPPRPTPRFLQRRRRVNIPCEHMLASCGGNVYQTKKKRIPPQLHADKPLHHSRLLLLVVIPLLVVVLLLP